jgi:hypothetical protein
MQMFGLCREVESEKAEPLQLDEGRAVTVTWKESWTERIENRHVTCLRAFHEAHNIRAQ